MADPVTTIRAVTELIAIVAPLVRGWGHNEEAAKLDKLRDDLLDKSDATLDRVIRDRSHD